MPQTISVDCDDNAEAVINIVKLNKEESILGGSHSSPGTSKASHAVHPLDDNADFPSHEAPDRNEDKDSPSDADEHVASDAENIDPVIPELAISPLKIRKTSIHPAEVVDLSLCISPLKPRKPSNESVAGHMATCTDHIPSSSDSADDSRNENTSNESGQSTPATTDSEDVTFEISQSLADTVSSSASTVGQIAQGLPPQISAVSNSSSSLKLLQSPVSMAVVSSNGVNDTRGRLPLASALRPDRGASPPSFTHSFVSSRAVSFKLNQYLVPDDPPWVSSLFPRSSIPRSPECNNLKGAAARPDLVRGDEYKIVVVNEPLRMIEEDPEKEQSDQLEALLAPASATHVAHQLSPIKELPEGDPYKDFFRDGSKSIREIGEVGDHDTNTNALVEAFSSPTRPTPIRMKRRPTVSNFHVVAKEQMGTPSPPDAPTTHGVFDESPIKRCAATTSSRVFRLTGPESEPEQEAEESVNKQDGGPITFHTPDLSLFDSNVEDFEAFEIPVSPSPLPKLNSKFNKRMPSGTWLSGKAIQDSTPQPDNDEGVTLHAISLPATPVARGPSTASQHILGFATPQPTPSPHIGLGLPYHPPQPTLAKPCTSLHSAAGTLFVAPPPTFASSVQASFNHSDATESSPSKSMTERVFRDVPGFHSAADHFGELSADFAEAVQGDVTLAATVASHVQAQPSSHTPGISTDVPVTEEFLPPVASPARSAFDIDTSRTPQSPSSEASASSSQTSMTTNETIIHTFNTAKAREQQRSIRAVLFHRTNRSTSSIRPYLRNSSWAKVENKLQKKSTLSTGARGHVGAGDVQGTTKKDMVKDVKKGRFGAWVDRVLGRGKKGSKD